MTAALWYAARGTGLVAQLLLTASLVFGVLNSLRFGSAGWPRFALAHTHRNLSLVAITFVAVHVAANVLDPYAGIGWLDALVPFGSVYRPVWLGLGSVAFDLVLALVVSSLLRRWIRYRFWRLVHWAAYLCWPTALVHGLGTGTDARTWWVLLVDAGCVVTVLIALGYRLTLARPQVRVVATLAATLALGTVVAWSLTGPLAPHWAIRSGTPSGLISGGQHR